MINLNQNNFILPLQTGSDLSMKADDQSGASGDANLASLFASMLTGAVNESQLVSKELSTEDLKMLSGNGESIDLQALLAANPELEAQIPQDLLKQFVLSGGEEHAALESFLEQATGQAIQLENELPQNLNQVVAMLQQQGVDTKSLIQSIDPKLLNEKNIEIQVDPKKGQAQGNLQFTSIKTDLAGLQNANFGNGQQGFSDQKQDFLKSGALQQSEQGKQASNEKSLLELVNGQLPEDTKALLDSIDKDLLKDDRFMQQFKTMLSNSPQNTSNIPQGLQQALGIQPGQPGLAPNFTQASPDSPILVRPMQVMTPVGQGEWAQQFNEQLVWLGSQQIKAASIKISPAELGPVEVNIKVVNDVASVQIQSHSGQVRDLIEQAMPRLKEMMTEQGLQLGNVDVQDNSEQHAMRKHQQFNGDKEGGASTNGFFDDVLTEDNDIEDHAREVVRQVKRGLVDYFA